MIRHEKGHAMSLELDATTAQLLVHLAEVWRVTEAEAMRLAVERATAAMASSIKEETTVSSRLQTFKELQQSLQMTSAKAQEWQDAILEARR
ncbi:MAG: hypothetical protein JWM21_3315 [Acidobacteria bacterium]|nr:hypothetical protein [Acidobacteriota bacterium]